MISAFTWLLDKIDPRRLRNRGRSLQREPASGERLTILVARLEDDDAKDSHQSHILRSLERQFKSLGAERAVDVLEDGLPLSLDDVEGTRSDAYVKAVETGQRRLKDTNSDVLIWGAVAKEGQVLSLRFLARQHDAAPESQGFGLNDVTELPAEFSEALSNVLTAEVIASAAPILGKSGWYTGDLLDPIITRLRPLVAHPPQGLTQESRGTLLKTLADAISAKAEQAGDNDALAEAIDVYRACLDARPRDHVPLDWAMTQNNLGNALQTLGRRRGDEGVLQEAVTAYRAALDVFETLEATAYAEIVKGNLNRAQAALDRLRDGGD